MTALISVAAIATTAQRQVCNPPRGTMQSPSQGVASARPGLRSKLDANHTKRGRLVAIHFSAVAPAVAPAVGPAVPPAVISKTGVGGSGGGKNGCAEHQGGEGLLGERGHGDSP